MHWMTVSAMEIAMIFSVTFLCRMVDILLVLLLISMYENNATVHA